MNWLRVTNKVFRGPEPRAEDYSTLEMLGVDTILDLEGALWEKLGGEFDDEVNDGRFTVRCVRLSAFFPPTKEQLAKCLTVFNRIGSVVYVHCKEGRDRTGFVIAYYRVKMYGWSVDEAIAEMKLKGFHLRYWYWIPFLRRHCK